jgi:hypothetical protein
MKTGYAIDRALAWFAAAAIPCAAFAGGVAPQSSRSEITSAQIEERVRFLASDGLKGRFTGTPEAVRAAEYLAQALKDAGVEPAGDGGTYLQRVPMGRIRYESVPQLAAWRDGRAEELRSGVDFDLQSGLPHDGERLRVRVVQKAEDVPAKADATLALFLDGSMSERRAWLGASKGAGFGLIVVPGSSKPGASADDEPPRARSLSGDAARVQTATVRAHGKLLERLRAGEVREIALACQARFEEEPAFNVVGRIGGAGTADEPALAEECVVFSAHYDHIGHREASESAAEGADTIFNGADDDASGCAAVIEIAEAFGASKAKPARTLVFLLATGEEIGLVGTNFYIEHPVVPLERTVCNLNFEMIGRPDALAGGAGTLWLTGYDLSNLGPELARLGLAIVADQRPDQHFFERSDNYAFAVRGVVAQTLSSYDLHSDYHRASDEADKLDFAHMEACVRAAFAASQALADGRIDPAWLEGKSPKR